jgi:endonuclease/exonuclease/phosphatase family metal-dependent hydrolase
MDILIGSERTNMNDLKRNPRQHILETMLYSILFLLILQLLTDFVEAVYGFGLFGSSIPPELVTILCLLSPLVLLFLPRGIARLPLIILGELLLLSRAVEAIVDTRGQLLLTGLGVACLMLFLPSLLKRLGDAGHRASGYTLTAGLAIGLSLAILLRALGAGLDITVDGSWRWLGWALALIAGVLLPIALPAGRPEPERGCPPLSAGKVIGFSIGFISVFINLFFAFTNPGILARWAEANYIAVFAGVFLALFVFALLFTNSRRFLSRLNRITLVVWNGMFVLAMVFSILPYQIRFPAELASYPLYEPVNSWIAQIPFALMIALFPVILIDFLFFSRELISGRPTWRRLGAGFSLAAFFLLIMIIAHVFTTVYDYIPVVGPLFRDRYWLVYLVAGLGLALPVLLVGKITNDLSAELGQFQWAITIPIVIALCGAAATASVWVVTAQPIAIPNQVGALKVFTYNVQQGYSGVDQRNYDGQIELIRSKDPDILGLAESDSARIANGNADLVHYFADKLNMYAYYGPKPITGTFGVALLSKYPMQNPHTFYVYSKGEQVASVIAQITANGKTYNVYVTHLGNRGPIFQQEAILKDVQGKENVILMGDFNFRTYEEQYDLTTGTLVDAWLQKWPGGVEDSGLNLEDRIDYVFVSPGMDVLDARYLTDPQSDHPALYVELH